MSPSRHDRQQTPNPKGGFVDSFFQCGMLTTQAQPLSIHATSNKSAQITWSGSIAGRSFKRFAMKRLLHVCASVLACSAFTGLAQSPPVLFVDVSADSQVRLSWASTAVGFVLEQV